MEEKEIWRDIAGYEGIYQVSNLGNVKSVSRTITYSGKNKFCTISAPIKEKVLKQVRGAGGRMYVSLRKDGKTKILSVSNIVADTFVDHINTLPYDNRVDNLRWVDAVENANNELTVLHTTGYGSQFRSGGNAKTRARARKKKGIGVDSYSTTVCLTEKTKEGAFVRLLSHDGKKICDFGVSYDSLVLLKNEIEQYIQETKKISV